MKPSNLTLRIVPLIVACPLFLQNLDTSVMATALPAIALSLQVPVLDLNLAITSYLLSLAVFLPASAWLAGRFGARRVFCAAVILFSLGSALCGAARTLSELVVCRLLQGVGGSMMVPVGRSILLRSIPASHLVKAMVWFTIPGAVGRLIGPLFGGAIVTVASWRWIFLVNVPFGLLGVALALWFVEKDPDTRLEAREPIDLVGLAWMAVALCGILGGLEMIGHAIISPLATVAVVGAGLLAFVVYVRRSRSVDHPILDFGVLRFSTFRIALLGGLPIRVALGAAPFLLPLLFQIGFSFSPLKSGLLTMALAMGALCTRATMVYAIRKNGFRKLMILSAILASCFFVSYSLFTPQTPEFLMFCAMFLGGLSTSMAMVSLNTVGYTDIPASRVTHASTMSAMSQQVSLALGVLLGATLLAAVNYLHGGNMAHLQPRDFSPAFLVIALLSLWSAFSFRELRPEDGEEMRGRERP